MTMTVSATNSEIRKDLIKFLKKNPDSELLEVFLHFLGKKHKVLPTLFPREKTIYYSLDELIKMLEKEGKLWRETEIKIQFGQQSVNEETKKIYICPYTGKVFGDNTHPNPQDAIYDWVGKCPENKERVGGLPVKRFFVSEDPEVIRNYIKDRKPPIEKTVYSSMITGKLFNSKEAIIQDFKKHHVKFLSLYEVQNQNRFKIEDSLLQFLQAHLNQEEITRFVEELSEYKEFEPFISKWVG